MTFKIRKGLEAPCKIKGLLSTDYWLMTGWLSAMAILLFLGVRSGFTSGEWSQCMHVILITAVGTPLIYKKLKGKARSRKYDEVKRDITISNLHLFKTIRR